MASCIAGLFRAVSARLTSPNRVMNSCLDTLRDGRQNIWQDRREVNLSTNEPKSASLGSTHEAPDRAVPRFHLATVFWLIR
jgi:hypothetical protein